MTWRPWVIVAAGIVAVILNTMFVATENIPVPELPPELKKVQEKLRTVQYLSANRRSNFELMGMTPDDANATATYISRYDRQTDKFKAILDDQSAELTEAFCPSEQLPQPYAAMRWLIVESNDRRDVVDPIQLRKLEPQGWYDRSLVPALYDKFERTDTRKPDATLMAVSASILNRESEAFDGVSPWSLGLVGTWGFAKLKRQDPRVQQLAIEYFALMHFLTELANSPRGICS